jgi:hypothetical protein
MTLTKDDLKIGKRYKWKNQPERLVYQGQVGRWHQFGLVDSPNAMWCEVLSEDLYMLEPTNE